MTGQDRSFGRAPRKEPLVKGVREIHRREMIIAAGAAVTVGLDAALSPKSEAAIGPAAKIDAHTHFAPPKFLEFAEQTEGRSFPLTPLYKSLPALTEVKPRLDLLDPTGSTCTFSCRFHGLRVFRRYMPIRRSPLMRPS